MGKEINEKTFELNITNELLNLSKSFIWYLNHVRWFSIPKIRTKKLLSQFLNQTVLFAEGLTQEEENNPLTGGYDVSINFRDPNGQEARLMFMQFKAGIRKSYSNKTGSIFQRRTKNYINGIPQHVMFTFNDAAGGTQHDTLRNLANSAGISPKSVMYVFPRITEKTELMKQAGNLIGNTSFVPVLEIDQQGSLQSPKIIIKNGTTHKYRTTYNGQSSEINLLLLLFNYNNQTVSDFVAELICIQIERLTKVIKEHDSESLNEFVDDLSKNFFMYVEYELNQLPTKGYISQTVQLYINLIRESIRNNNSIPNAPSIYTTILPREGLQMHFEGESIKFSIKYQIF